MCPALGPALRGPSVRHGAHGSGEQPAKQEHPRLPQEASYTRLRPRLTPAPPRSLWACGRHGCPPESCYPLTAEQPRGSWPLAEGFLLAAVPFPGAGCQRTLRFLCGLSCSESRVVGVPWQRQPGRAGAASEPVLGAAHARSPRRSARETASPENRVIPSVAPSVGVAFGGSTNSVPLLPGRWVTS